jgi:3-phosphoshikimate 1-carboxyvinyltransferase
VDVAFRAVPSKSDTHRALVAAALARGESEIVAPLLADDTSRTRDGLAALGARFAEFPSTWRVEGTAGSLPGGAKLSLGESGTTCRLLSAVAALGVEPSLLDGAPRLRERPLRPLLEALASLGARIEADPRTGGLPLRIGGRPLRGGAVRVPGGQTSQFASALLLVGARLPGGLEVEVEPPHVSLPYLRMTLLTLSAFGVVASQPREGTWRVPETDYAGLRYRVEGDHSSASYFLAAAVATGGRVRVDGLEPDSLQADAAFGPLLRAAGARVSSAPGSVTVESAGTLDAFDVDLSAAPDLAPTVAVVALFAGGECRLRGLGHLRLKESDRLDAVAEGLRTLGAAVAIEGDALRVAPPARARGGIVQTRSDHRLAMAFAVAGLRIPGVVVDDAACVAKSNPGFWDDFAALEAGGVRTGS